ncbi:hypothetical protein JTB14_025355 [Gonioctena quinquepunctata]|nr:hypothetical protein JTB14_025355 [Gonioctena quinquepunctata]
MGVSAKGCEESEGIEEEFCGLPRYRETFHLIGSPLWTMFAVGVTYHVPNNEKEWDDVAKRLYSKWNYPNCIGALDGKHVVLQAPANSGSLYYDYKGSFSIVLMALCEADYNVLYVDEGVQGRECDAGVFLGTDLYVAVEENTLQIPPKRVLPGRNVDMPFVIVADDAFAMSERIMKPFVGRHSEGSIERAFNYRHSRARRSSSKTYVSATRNSKRHTLLLMYLIQRTTTEMLSTELGEMTEWSFLDFDGVSNEEKILANLPVKNWLTFFRVSLCRGNITMLSYNCSSGPYFD